MKLYIFVAFERGLSPSETIIKRSSDDFECGRRDTDDAESSNEVVFTGRIQNYKLLFNSQILFFVSFMTI